MLLGRLKYKILFSVFCRTLEKQGIPRFILHIMLRANTLSDTERNIAK